MHCAHAWQLYRDLLRPSSYSYTCVTLKTTLTQSICILCQYRLAFVGALYSYACTSVINSPRACVFCRLILVWLELCLLVPVFRNTQYFGNKAHIHTPPTTLKSLWIHENGVFTIYLYSSCRSKLILTQNAYIATLGQLYKARIP